MKAKLKNHFKEYSWLDWALLLLVVVQLAFLLYEDLFRVPIAMDNDASKTFVRAMEVWKQGTIYLPNWSQMTTLETGNPSIMAVVFYGLFHNIYLAYALANAIMVTLFICVFNTLLNRMQVGTTGKLISIVLLITPLSFGQLLYYNMIFYAVGAYSFRLLIPLLMVVLLTEESSHRVPWILTVVLTCVMIFLCAISTGIYVFATALLPAIIVYSWMGILKREHIYSDLFCRKNIGLFATLITFIVGVGIYYYQGLISSGTMQGLISVNELMDSFRDVVFGWMELFGVLPHIPGGLMSVSGLTCLLRFVIAVIVLIVFIMYCGRSFKDLFSKDDEHAAVNAMLFMIAVFGIFICVVTGTGDQCRYMMLATIPAYLYMGEWADGLFDMDTLKRNQSGFLKILVCGVLFVVALLSDYGVYRADCFPQQAADNVKLHQILDMLADYPEKEVVLLNDTGSAENLRLFDCDSDREYLSYMLTADEWNGTGLVVHDYYVDVTDATAISDDHILIVNDNLGQYEQLPVYIRKNYKEVDSYQNFTIYKGNLNRMDGITGYAYNEVAKDYPDTDGYVIYSGEMDEDGRLAATGNDDYVLASPMLGDANGSVDVTMDYEALSDADASSVGRLEVWDAYSHELISQVEINTNDTSATVSQVGLDGRNLVVKVYVNSGCEIKIADLIFTR